MRTPQKCSTFSLWSCHRDVKRRGVRGMRTAPLKNRLKLAKSLPLLAVAARLAAVWNWVFHQHRWGKAHGHSFTVAAQQSRRLNAGGAQRFVSEQKPTGDEGNSAKRRDGAQNARAGNGKRIKAAGEKQDAYC